MSFRTLVAVLVLAAAPSLALSQGTKMAFGDTTQDTSAPIEVTADSLAINQTDGSAIYSGNVIIGQGNMRMSAPRVAIFYNEEQSELERLEATGGVTLVSGDDAAEAQRAEYLVSTGNIIMTGNVLLSQGKNGATAERMVVNLETGEADLSGRVKTILQPGNN